MHARAYATGSPRLPAAIYFTTTKVREREGGRNRHHRRIFLPGKWAGVLPRIKKHGILSRDSDSVILSGECSFRELEVCFHQIREESSVCLSRERVHLFCSCCYSFFLFPSPCGEAMSRPRCVETSRIDLGKSILASFATPSRRIPGS